MLIPPFKMKKYTVCISLFCMFLSSEVIAQKSSEFNTNDSAVAIKDLGFQAKLMHLTANPTTALVEEPVKKSTRSLSDILNKSKKELRKDQFHLIAGCFSSEKNATKLNEQLIAEGYNATVFQEENSDLYFVAYESYGDEIVATKALAKLKKKGVDTWLSKY